ncbi:MAG: polysaccharide biosynthesis C-terminal domain-containing protein [Actinomycetota bacterium]
MATSSNGGGEDTRKGGLRGAIEGILPAERFGDHRNILGNTGQNVLGLAIGAIATFAAQVLMTNALGADKYGVVTLTTQFAFVAAAATRFGMDAANIRLVAILAGRGEQGRVRGLVSRSAAIAAVVSVLFGAIAFFASDWLARTWSALPDVALPAFQAAAIGIPLGGLAFTYMGATRGLKIMRYTLYGQWMAQPIGWIVLSVALWSLIAKSAGVTSLAFSASWGLALLIAWFGWEKETRRYSERSGEVAIPEEHTRALLRFGAFRAPATLFAQLIFWTDFFVLSSLSSGAGASGATAVGVYGAVLRVGQSLFLFLTSVSLTFSPFVADLHHRGERERLDGLYRAVTRWTLAATIPILLLLAILPGAVLRIFGSEFVQGEGALRIIIAGMIVPVMVGTVGFILIMVGRTGWDLLVYMAGFAIDIGVAFWLARPEVLGIRGAAIAQALTLSFSAVARLYLVRRFVGIWPFDRHFLRLIGPALAGAATMIVVHTVLPSSRWLVDLVVSGGTGVVVYGVALVSFGLRREERRAVFAVGGRLVGRGTS